LTADAKAAMPSTLISTADLAARLADPSLILLDVRHDLAQPEAWGRERYGESHLPGASFVHIDHDLSAAKTGSNGRHPLPSPEAAAALFGRLGVTPQSLVVAYDQAGGMFASRAWWMLRALGHENVAVLDGGFDKWAREGRPLTTDVVERDPVAFVPRPMLGTVDAEAVLADREAGRLSLLDARASERYRGETEPLDPVAGHIPGARNRFWGSNLNPDGTFKPHAVLRAEFADTFGDTPLERIVHYCGSGVTACHNLLAMEVAGLPGTRLYPGSWSEWCADPARPVAVGDEGGSP